jgi:hypothetical protein
MMQLQSLLSQIRDSVMNFNNWVAASWVGYKTKFINALVALAGAGLVVTQMFDVIDVRTYMTDSKMAGYFMLGIALLNYWLKVITDKAKVVA